MQNRLLCALLTLIVSFLTVSVSGASSYLCTTVTLAHINEQITIWDMFSAERYYSFYPRTGSGKTPSDSSIKYEIRAVAVSLDGQVVASALRIDANNYEVFVKDLSEEEGVVYKHEIQLPDGDDDIGSSYFEISPNNEYILMNYSAGTVLLKTKEPESNDRMEFSGIAKFRPSSTMTESVGNSSVSDPVDDANIKFTQVVAYDSSLGGMKLVTFDAGTMKILEVFLFSGISEWATPPEVLDFGFGGYTYSFYTSTLTVVVQHDETVSVQLVPIQTSDIVSSIPQSPTNVFEHSLDFPKNEVYGQVKLKGDGSDGFILFAQDAIVGLWYPSYGSRIEWEISNSVASSTVLDGTSGATGYIVDVQDIGDNNIGVTYRNTENDREVFKIWNTDFKIGNQIKLDGPFNLELLEDSFYGCVRVKAQESGPGTSGAPNPFGGKEVDTYRTVACFFDIDKDTDLLADFSYTFISENDISPHVKMKRGQRCTSDFKSSVGKAILAIFTPEIIALFVAALLVLVATAYFIVRDCKKQSQRKAIRKARANQKNTIPPNPTPSTISGSGLQVTGSSHLESHRTVESSGREIVSNPGRSVIKVAKVNPVEEIEDQVVVLPVVEDHAAEHENGEELFVAVVAPEMHVAPAALREE